MLYAMGKAFSTLTLIQIKVLRGLFFEAGGSEKKQSKFKKNH